MSNRIFVTEKPYIEDVLDKYSSLNDLTILALGSSHWNPPFTALQKIFKDIETIEVNRYGNILGLPELRSKIQNLLRFYGLNVNDLEVAVTAGANQAFMSAALAVCDNNDNCLIMAPYYFSHKLALQMCGANVTICPFDQTNLSPKWDVMQEQFDTLKPTLVFLFIFYK
jgi:aspartate/methionine/tyrosine aminotransferase